MAKGQVVDEDRMGFNITNIRNPKYSTHLDATLHTGQYGIKNRQQSLILGNFFYTVQCYNTYLKRKWDFLNAV